MKYANWLRVLILGMTLPIMAADADRTYDKESPRSASTPTLPEHSKRYAPKITAVPSGDSCDADDETQPADAVVKSNSKTDVAPSSPTPAAKKNSCFGWCARRSPKAG